MARLLGHRGAAVVLASRSGADVAAAVEWLPTRTDRESSGRQCDTGELADIEALRDEALNRRDTRHLGQQRSSVRRLRADGVRPDQ